jgi:hypothetical protein
MEKPGEFLSTNEQHLYSKDVKAGDTVPAYGHTLDRRLDNDKSGYIVLHGFVRK